MESRETEEKILAAAFKVADRYALSGTRMHLIAEEAKLVQSNLHYYFKTKQDLLLALLQYIQKYFSETRRSVLEQEQGTLEDGIKGFFQQKKNIILNAPEYDRVQVDFWRLSQTDERFAEPFYEFFDTWRKDIFQVLKLYAPEIKDSRIWMASCVMLSMMMGTSLQYLESEEAFDLDDYFEACLDMIMKHLDS